ncbi:nitronate monooxygenase [Micromonospora sp. WMMC415]|uniref:nitronate monooxygenase n=1 Tax=Micromonospora sp. WMMC415 TaxID=2675222 RepID=UPI001E5DA6F0|nr:nitronate monooxygenase [Micromonospora sp. WMMC415]
MSGDVWTDFVSGATPVVGAPMAGGATTCALVSAVAAAGGFGFVAAGYKTPEAVAAELAELRAAGTPCGVNLFVPGPPEIGEAEFRRYAGQIAAEGGPYGLDLAAAPLLHDDDHWRDKIDLLLADPVPVASFTFGLPDPAHRRERSEPHPPRRRRRRGPHHTVITRAFTGRPARGLRNGFVERYEATAPLGYPAVHHLTRGMRAAAAAAGDPDRLHLWAGTGYRSASTGPAGAVVDLLAAAL